MRLFRKWKQVRTVKISREEYGDAWPFVEGIDGGVLQRKPVRQDPPLDEITLVTNGKTYALNGIAKQAKKYLSLEEIWAFDPFSGGEYRINIEPIIKRGLDLR